MEANVVFEHETGEYTPEYGDNDQLPSGNLLICYWLQDLDVAAERHAGAAGGMFDVRVEELVRATHLPALRPRRRPAPAPADREVCCGRLPLRGLGGREPRGSVAHLGLGCRPGLELLLHALVGVGRRRGGALPAAALLDPERLREAVGQRRRRRLLEGVEGQVYTLRVPPVPPRERGRAQGRVAVAAALALLRSVSYLLHVLLRVRLGSLLLLS